MQETHVLFYVCFVNINGYIWLNIANILLGTSLVANVSVQSQTNQPPVSSLIQQRRLKLFGHIARAAASEDHSRALRTSADRLPVDWRRPRGRPRQSWLRTIDSDLKPLNLGLHSALQRATDRPFWQHIVEKAMLFERATWWWWVTNATFYILTRCSHHILMVT